MCKQQQQQQHDDDGGGSDEEYQMGLNMRSLEKTSKCPLKNEVTSQYFLFIGLRLQSDNILPFGQSIRHTDIHTHRHNHTRTNASCYVQIKSVCLCFLKDIVSYALLLFLLGPFIHPVEKGRTILLNLNNVLIDAS